MARPPCLLALVSHAGGDLRLVNMPGYGVDAFLTLQRLNQDWQVCSRGMWGLVGYAEARQKAGFNKRSLTVARAEGLVGSVHACM